MTAADFAVLADLPLGAYRAHGPGGGVDLLPAPARLHAALLCAAATGTRATLSDGVLSPTDADVDALSWLEVNPPDGALIPRHARSAAATRAYRGLGLRETRAGAERIRLVGKDSGDSVAVTGAFAWTWSTAPPPEVVEALTALTPDVSHLGTSESPARLRVGAAVPTHRRDPDADLFTAEDGVDLDVPESGRTAALRALHAAATVTPSPKQDLSSANEPELRPAAENGWVVSARYAALDTSDEPEGPWSVVLVAALGRSVQPGERVSWAVTLHRALVAAVGYGAPGVLTGAYGTGAHRPANRVAVQFLDRATASALDLAGDHGVVLVALPTGIDPVESATVTAAFTGLRVLRRRSMSCRLHHLGARPGRRLWPAGPAGAVRSWATTPVAVPDTRPQRRVPWSLADAVALSAALVVRDRWPEAGDRSDQRYRRLADAAVESGLTVESARRVTDSRPDRWVHRRDPGVVVQPYEAVLRLGDIAGSRAFLAIGQSRHLGGGLLVPTDLVAPA